MGVLSLLKGQQNWDRVKSYNLANFSVVEPRAKPRWIIQNFSKTLVDYPTQREEPSNSEVITMAW